MVDKNWLNNNDMFGYLLVWIKFNVIIFWLFLGIVSFGFYNGL